MTEPTFTGYISSTHDALLIFECVRRGIMPKVSRRLREDERRYIRSGSVFVFDERESGIKRWTDGLLWSPSRILWNFLVYRQIEKRSSKTSDPTSASGYPLKSPTSEYVDPLAQGVGFPSQDQDLSVFDPRGPSSAHLRMNEGASRGRSISSASDSAQAWYGGGAQNGAMRPGQIGLPNGGGGPNGRRDADIERALVGSLRSSYPFAKDGLCKKTISIQVDGSTQHLISYYKVDDVRNGRLRSPLSLPEIASLQISPIILHKSNFRNPPDIGVLPDGTLQYRGDGSEASRRAAAGQGSGSEGTSGSEGRPDRGPGVGGFGIGPSNGFGSTAISPLDNEAMLPHVNYDARYVPTSRSNLDPSTQSVSSRRLSGSMMRDSWSMGPSAAMSNRYEPYSTSGPRQHGYMGQGQGFDINSQSVGVRHRSTISGGSGSVATEHLLRRPRDDPSTYVGQWPEEAPSHHSPSLENGTSTLWPLASDHAARPTSSSSMPASYTAMRPRGATTGTWQPQIHPNGNGAENGSNGMHGVRYLNDTVGQAANGHNGPTNALGLRGTAADTTLQYGNHSPAGLPAVLDSSLEQNNQGVGRSAALENLASSVGLRGGPEAEQHWQHNNHGVDPDVSGLSNSGPGSRNSAMGSPAVQSSKMFAAQPDGRWPPPTEPHYSLQGTGQQQHQQQVGYPDQYPQSISAQQYAMRDAGVGADWPSSLDSYTTDIGVAPSYHQMQQQRSDLNYQQQQQQQQQYAQLYSGPAFPNPSGGSPSQRMLSRPGMGGTIMPGEQS
ncbi:unnamed protein product [Jaminaea pallidilutea]